MNNLSYILPSLAKHILESIIQLLLYEQKILSAEIDDMDSKNLSVHGDKN